MYNERKGGKDDFDNTFDHTNSPPPNLSNDSSLDYYAILNVSKEANEEEIKNAYRRLCILYHPDKHLDASSKQIANNIFSKIHSAYLVLSEKRLRSIYDEFGIRGVEASMQVGEYFKGDLVRLREQLKKSLRSSGSYKSKTVVSSGIDATMLSEDLSSISDQLIWQDYAPTVNSFSLSHKIEGVLDEKTSATLVHSVAIKNSTGSGVLNGLVARQLTERLQGRIDFSIGSQKKLGSGLTFAFNQKMSFGLYFAGQFYGGAIDTLYHLTFSRAILDQYALTANLFNSGAALSIAKASEDNPISASLTYLWETANLGFDTKASFSLDQRNLFKVRFSTTGPVNFSLSLIRKSVGNDGDGSKNSYSIETGSAFGVGLKYSYSFDDFTLILPIYISRSLSSHSIILGIGIPSLLGLLVHNFIYQPLFRRNLANQWATFREQQRHLIEQRKEEAQLAITLMTSFYNQKLANETAIDGLIIKSAIYQATIPTTTTIDSSLDVTIPLQISVIDSQVYLNASSKADLLGFYDVAVGASKILKVKYLFKTLEHFVIVKDNQRLIIPQRHHLIE